MMSAKPLSDALSREAGAVMRPVSPRPPWESGTLQVDVTLALILRMIKRRKWLLILTLIIVPLLAGFATLKMTPRFTASADLVIEPQRLNIADIQSILTQSAAGSDVIASEIEILSSRALAAQVIQRLELFRLPEFNPSLRPPGLGTRLINSATGMVAGLLGQADEGDDAREEVDIDAGDAAASTAPEIEIDIAEIIDIYLGSLDVQVRGGSRVVEVSYTSVNPELAARIVNTLVDIYLVNQLEAKFDALKRASAWLNERLAALREQARQSDEAVQQYRAEAGLTQGVQASIVAEQITRLNTELGAARFAFTTARAKLDQVRSFANSPSQLESLPEVLDYPVVQQLVQQQALLDRQVVDMSSKLGERHPDLLNMRAQAQANREQIAREIQRVIRRIEPDVDAARSRVMSLEEQLQLARDESIKYAADEAKLQSLQREAETNQGLLQTFLERAKETSDRFELESADARLLANAVVPTSPSEPKTSIILAASIAFAGMLGLLLVYVAEQLDLTIRSGDDLEGALGVPCLSIVPKLTMVGGLINPHDYVLNKPMSAYAEAFRSLRAALWLGSEEARGSCKSVVVISSRPGEGKTATSISLARVAAAGGEKVILVDCDVRQPAVGKALKADPGRGLVDILRGEVNWRQAVNKDSSSDMDYILIGTHTSNSAQLLMSEMMVSLVHSLRAEYDLVVLDAPPILALSDARIIASVADGVVYCVRWRDTSRSAVSSGLRILRGIGANVVGAVLTQVNLTSHARAGFSDSEFYSRKYSGYYRN